MRPSRTWLSIHHDTGATRLYHGQFVSSEWQFPQECASLLPILEPRKGSSYRWSRTAGVRWLLPIEGTACDIARIRQDNHRENANRCQTLHYGSAYAFLSNLGSRLSGRCLSL